MAIEKMFEVITARYTKFLNVRPMIYNKQNFIDQKDYQSVVRMLLFLAKHYRPHIANVTRELSKANHDANPAAFKELLHVLRYLLETKNWFKVRHNQECKQPWEKIVCLNESDYMGDPVIRRSICGFILCVLIALIS